MVGQGGVGYEGLESSTAWRDRHRRSHVRRCRHLAPAAVRLCEVVRSRNAARSSRSHAMWVLAHTRCRRGAVADLGCGIGCIGACELAIRGSSTRRRVEVRSALRRRTGRAPAATRSAPSHGGAVDCRSTVACDTVLVADGAVAAGAVAADRLIAADSCLLPRAVAAGAVAVGARGEGDRRNAVRTERCGPRRLTLVGSAARSSADSARARRRVRRSRPPRVRPLARDRSSRCPARRTRCASWTS